MRCSTDTRSRRHRGLEGRCKGLAWRMHDISGTRGAQLSGTRQSTINGPLRVTPGGALEAVRYTAYRRRAHGGRNTPMSPARQLLPFLRPYRGAFAKGLVCVIVATAVQLAGPWILK